MAKRLGEILLAEGKISESQLQKALESQQLSSGGAKTIGAILVEMGALNDEAVARGLSIQKGHPYVDPAQFKIEPELVAKLPRELAERHLLIPLERDADGTLHVAMVDPLNLHAIQDLEFVYRARLRTSVASASAVRLAIRKHYDLWHYAERFLSEPSGEGRPSLVTQAPLELDANVKEKLKQGGADQYVNLLNALLFNAIESGASDIHIEPGSDDVRVRFRIDGLLREVLRLPTWVEPPLISRIKVVGELDMAVHKKPQDGKVSANLGPRRVDLRISVVPIQFGEKAVIRLLDPAMLKADLGLMGWQPRALSAYYRMVSQPQGLVLVVGPTGSGKSTTLYGTIERLRSENSAIVTIENPVEYTLPGIAQIQVDERSGLSFAGALRSILRQDPNVIVIGEIRDAETAHAAIDAATTGHLVLSTLHTSQTVSTIARLLELSVPSHLLGTTLLGIVAQRLVRRVCGKCSILSPVDPEDWTRLGIRPIPLGKGVRKVGPGCSECLYTGYKGRVGVFEVLHASEAMREAIGAGRSEPELWNIARAEGLTTLLEDAFFKVHAGTTTIQELARVVPVDPWRKDTDSVPAPSQAQAPWRPTWAASLPAAAVPAPAQPSSERPTLRPPPERATIPPPSPSQPPPPPQERIKTVVEKLPLEKQPLVLIVDDAEEILRLVSITLEDQYRTALARDGIEALESAEKLRPDLIILDVMMPRLSGYDACLRIKEQPGLAHIPVLMLSARGERNAITRGFYAGADDYLPKPFDPEELLLRIRALLRRSRASLPAHPEP